MLKRNNKTAAALMGPALALGSLLLLTACDSLNSAVDDVPQDISFNHRFPIDVRTAPGTNRKVAVTKECGDWSDNLARTNGNHAYINHGCAFQSNLAAIVSDPNDFVKPRKMPGARAVNRVDAVGVYDKSPEAAFDPGTIIDQ